VASPGRHADGKGLGVWQRDPKIRLSYRSTRLSYGSYLNGAYVKGNFTGSRQSRQVEVAATHRIFNMGRPNSCGLLLPSRMVVELAQQKTRPPAPIE